MRCVGFTALLLVAGCDRLFKLETFEHPPDAPPCTPIGHDEDHDGIDDACDPCPFDRRNDGDGDADGIADACDPEPTVPNVPLLFSGFGPSTWSEFTLSGGAFANDAYHGAGGSVAVIWNSPVAGPVSVVAGVDVTMLDSTAMFHEVGIVFDAMPTGSNILPDGTYCVLGANVTPPDYLEVFGRTRPNSDVQLAAADAGFRLSELRGAQLRGSRTVDAPTANVACTFTTPSSEIALSGSRSPAPTTGGIALYADGSVVDFAYVFVVRRM